MQKLFAGPALVFEGEEAMIAAISEDPMSFKVRMLMTIIIPFWLAVTFSVEMGIKQQSFKCVVFRNTSFGAFC